MQAFLSFNVNFLLNRRGLLCLIGCLVSACSTSLLAPRLETSSPPVLSKIALVGIEGEENTRTIIEVAWVNQCLRQGIFTLISRQRVEEARQAPGQDPLDLKGIAQKVGADYALVIHVLEWQTQFQKTPVTTVISDSQWAAEQGSSQRQQIQWVKTLEGQVRFQFEWIPVRAGSLRTQVIEERGRVSAEVLASQGNSSLPSPLSFLSELTEKAFAQAWPSVQSSSGKGR